MEAAGAGPDVIHLRFQELGYDAANQVTAAILKATVRAGQVPRGTTTRTTPPGTGSLNK